MIKKIVAVAFIGLVSLSLGGCQGGFGTFTSAITNPIKNPVNNNALGGAISTYGILDTAVIAYRGLPRCTVNNNFSATNICHKRSVLVQAQKYDLAANTAINKAVDFQRTNPTLDATSYVNAALLAVATFKDFASVNNLPGVQ